MTLDEFDAALQEVEVTRGELADMLGVQARTVERWVDTARKSRHWIVPEGRYGASSDVEFPPYVKPILELLRERKELARELDRTRAVLREVHRLTSPGETS